MSKKDLIGLNLSEYNTSEHPVASKFFAIILYLLEYIIILPFIIFFWFAVLAIIILLLSSKLTASQILIVSASLVIAIRILSYYKEDLSAELAKIFPFTLLVILLIDPNFFSLERIISNLKEIPAFATSLILFFILITAVELFFRIIDTIANFFSSDNEDE